MTSTAKTWPTKGTRPAATAEQARASERIALEHRTAGRIDAAYTFYNAAAVAWREVAARCARHGETLISDAFMSEARKNERKADAILFEVLS
ncbi:MAG: hypothetical protein RI571_06565 [Roseovarius sp.]|nr:hypothetical protein [Roseovarius sp.]